MATCQDKIDAIQAQIDALSADIAAGIEQTVVDGTMVKVSLAVKQQERSRLERRLRTLKRGRGSAMIRPIDLGGF